MKFLIRFISRTAGGGTEQHDRLVDARVITMGRATDRMLHLRDRRARLEHAQLEERDGGVHITAAALAGVPVNGRSQRDARLAVGDVVEVGSNLLRIIAAPPGADFAFTFELRADAGSEAGDPGHYSAEARRYSLRSLCWILVAVVLLPALILPGLGVMYPTLAAIARDSRLLPDDSWWLAGPLHSAHTAAGADCQSCHVVAFRRVPDEACTACHEVNRHVAGDEHAVLGARRCAACHLEHNEPPELVKRHQGLCADCHSELPADVPLEDASDFLLDHPGFKVSLLQPQLDASGNTAWVVQHRLLAEARTADRSNLKFNHAAHLDADGILAPQGKRVIDCTECHQPEPGGARMRPIRMDQHCAGCHSLDFDPDDPRRTVPHGDPAAVMQVLIEYYSARLLGDDADAGEQRVRRPGRALTRADRDRAAAEARVRAMQVAEDLFERRVCVNCHEVSCSDSAALPWLVQPVKLTEQFFPHSNFTHTAHDTAASGCDSCHDASVSETSAELLIPAIESCRDCHGSAVARHNNASQVPSTCIMCHSFHFESKGSYP